MKVLVHDDPECLVYGWNPGEQMDLTGWGPLAYMSPREIHIKPDGDINDQPSFAFVGVDAYGVVCCFEISLAKLAPATAVALAILIRRNAEASRAVGENDAAGV